ncbi:MAG TPA: His/Gly/Thr/Pro-type tRNA ligase C-terminal domain-containing protein, partial [Candidatus Paceibacterota bacterium]
EVGVEDRAHYSKRTIDFEYDYPFGRKELYGLAYRTDHDLKKHMESSGADMGYQEEGTDKFVPHVVEPSFGAGRTFLAILDSAYTEDELGGEARTYLRLSPKIAPVKAAVFPLLKNKPELVEKAREVYKMLKKEIPQVVWDDNGNIGKRYRRQDEIGTPFCITIDFDTLGESSDLKDTVTLRHRDSGEQERMAASDLIAYIKGKI